MIAKVAVDIATQNLDRCFDYKIPDGMEISRGDMVKVPFSNFVKEGFVLDIAEKSEYEKLKSILEKKDTKLVGEKQFELCDFLIKKYHIITQEALRLLMPPSVRNFKTKEVTKKTVTLENDFEEKLQTLSKRNKNAFKIVEELQINEADFTTLAKKYSYQTLAKLEELQIIKIQGYQVFRTPYKEDTKEKTQRTLTADQQNAYNTIFATNKKATLLHGVTGSGKTEVYIKAIDKVLKEGKTAIFLVPEISLTPQMLNLFRVNFGEKVALLHSGLSAGERFDEWWRLKNKSATVAVGARSAIFAPLENIGIIIVDEEHESSYKSETSPRYETKDVAEFLAKSHNAKLVYGSATPAIESYKKAVDGEYQLCVMPNRINKRPLPQVEIVDMRREIQNGNAEIFSEKLIEEITDTLKQKNQIMLFLNRRGYSSIYQCLECGFVCKCDNCDVSLTYHKGENNLKCHYCGDHYNLPKKCPHCGGEHFKTGKIGTEKVGMILKDLFPEIRVLRMDNDTTTTKESHKNILSDFRDGKADVLIGTQMIAKGHDFENVTLVGILDADMSLYFSDFRANERTFSLLTQVAGRAGRGEKVGKVVLQTNSPRHHILHLAIDGDYKGLYESEINLREVSQFPPFCDIIRVMCYSKNHQKARELGRVLFKEIRTLKNANEKEFFYMNGMQSPIFQLQGNYRFQIIARVKPNSPIINEIYNIVSKNKENGVTSYVEINPNSMI
ncbi:MAG: primosomal protein N' [Bacillota bacterium]